jgi:hypothetical protein
MQAWPSPSPCPCDALHRRRVQRTRKRASPDTEPHGKRLEGSLEDWHQANMGIFCEFLCPAKRASVSGGDDAKHRRGEAVGGCVLARNSANGPPGAGEAPRSHPLPWLREAPSVRRRKRKVSSIQYSAASVQYPVSLRSLKNSASLRLRFSALRIPHRRGGGDGLQRPVARLLVTSLGS